jgi:hypothetical protein
MGDWRYSSSIPDPGTRWMLVAASSPGRFTAEEKSFRYPFYTRLGGPQSQSRLCGVEKNLLPGIEPQSSNL